MNPEEKQMLQEALSLAKDNNSMLHSMRRAQMWASIMRVIYWILIIGISYGAYIYTQPYLDKAVNLFKSSQAQLDSLKSVTNQFKLK
ncbi:MAG: hypothetical protein NTW62_00195 [Candidatus Nomurabacteria bacterium]|nr:hypothetical protein [Candidatus Nomurabacteria bacterium]